MITIEVQTHYSGAKMSLDTNLNSKTISLDNSISTVFNVLLLLLLFKRPVSGRIVNYTILQRTTCSHDKSDGDGDDDDDDDDDNNNNNNKRPHGLTQIPW